MTEDKMIGWHHQLNGHDFEQALGDSEGQGSLVCCSPWGCKESDMNGGLNYNKMIMFTSFLANIYSFMYDNMKTYKKRSA